MSFMSGPSYEQESQVLEVKAQVSICISLWRHTSLRDGYVNAMGSINIDSDHGQLRPYLNDMLHNLCLCFQVLPEDKQDAASVDEQMNAEQMNSEQFPAPVLHANNRCVEDFVCHMYAAAEGWQQLNQMARDQALQEMHTAFVRETKVSHFKELLSALTASTFGPAEVDALKAASAPNSPVRTVASVEQRVQQFSPIREAYAPGFETHREQFAPLPPQAATASSFGSTSAASKRRGSAFIALVPDLTAPYMPPPSNLRSHTDTDEEEEVYYAPTPNATTRRSSSPRNE